MKVEIIAKLAIRIYEDETEESVLAMLKRDFERGMTYDEILSLSIRKSDK